MLPEAMAWLLTPASRLARRYGALSESIAIAARHRRCREAWRPHLARTREALLASAQSAPGHRLGVVVGSGHLLDVPLDALAPRFERLWLIDLVHPWTSRIASCRHRNVRLITRDITGFLDQPGAPVPSVRYLLDQPDLDWVASVNLLSQLAAPARRAWQATGAGTPDPGLAIQHAHLAWLRALPCPACLVTDLEQVTFDVNGQVLDRTHYEDLLAGWRCLDQWHWELAPPGELGQGRRSHHRVGWLIPEP